MRFFLLALMLAACSDPYADTKKIDTIEAWQKFLTEHKPSTSQKLAAEQRLEDLLVAKARETKAVADYDAVLKRFPDSREKKKLAQERAEAAFAAAEKAGTPEAWKTFLDENKGADSVLVKKATNMVTVTSYGDKLVVGETKVEQVNLAEDPKGPKDGWGFTTEVTNTGDKTVSFCNLEVRLLGADGGKLKAFQWPLVANAGPGGMPIQEEYTKPLAPGEKRTWTYATGEVPDGWAQTAQTAVVNLRLTDGAEPPK